MLDLTELLHLYGSTAGYLILSGIIFAETGLLIGFFLPGDTILFPAGLFAAQGYFNIYLLCMFTFIAAILGNCVGYFFGKRVGPKIFNKEESLFFHKDHLLKARAFYNKHGGKTVILARFVPIIRTFAPIIAGVSDMNFKVFFFYSVVGALLWAIGIPVAGYFFGHYIPDIDKYILPIILLVIVLSIGSSAYEMIRTQERRQRLLKALTRKK